MANNTLKRSLNLPLLTLYGLGTILGAGVYVLVGKVAGIAGLYAPIAFLVSSIVAIFTGLSYAALSARYPRSAGEVVYINQAFSSATLSTWVGWCVIATGVVSAATMVNGFIGYLTVFIQTPTLLAVTLIVASITFIAYWGIMESVTIAALITVLEIVGLLLVIYSLRGELLTLPHQWQTLLPPVNGDIWLGILLGAFLAFYAFIGFEDMVNVAEEVVAPQRTLPIAIIAALLMASVLYILIALAAALSLPPDALSQSDSPMVMLIENHNPQLATPLGIISLIAIINGVLVQVIMGSRILYGMACQQLISKLFSRVSAKTQTPTIATVTIALTVWTLALGFPIVTLAKATSFIIITVFALVNLSLLVIRYREKPYRLFELLMPLTGGLLCLGLLALQVVSWI
ncbi:MAG: amino acid permease [Cellvibrionales bacterium]|nr:amino acid permease [Cellvibrionales bacterium]